MMASGRREMIARIVVGVLLAYLLIAYFPLVMQGLPYFVMLALGVAAFWCLRAAPELAEPLGYGILIVLLCYMVFLFLRRKDKLKEIVKNAREKKVSSIFIMTTQAADWFEKLGFVQDSVESLPQERRAIWTKERNSKVYRLSQQVGQ